MLGIKYQIKPESLRQTDLLPASTTSPSAPPPSFLLSGPRDSHSPPDELYRGVTGCGQGVIDSLLMLLFLAHTHTQPSPSTRTHTPHSPPPPPGARALAWVSVIAPGLVPCRLHSTIHTNHSVSAL